MKLATWNVNSLKVRLPHVLDWLAANQPDVLCLQETKLEDANFPVTDIEAAGYRVLYSGQKTYNGVALVARGEGVDATCGIPGFADEQKRVIAATYGDVRVVCAYFPNGQSLDSEKYQYKLRWLEAMHGCCTSWADIPSWPCWATTTSRRKTGTCTTPRPGKGRCW